MKWLLARRSGEVNIYPEMDILPHMHDVSCPCRTAVICLSKGESVKLALEEDMGDTFVANEDMTVVLHNSITEKLLESNN